MKKVILDCDPGHDDVIAMILLLAAENISVVGITTSAGNQTQAKTSENTLKILTLLKYFNVPVAKGMEKPIKRELIIADNIHGKTGLDGADLPEKEIDLVNVKAIDFIAQQLRQSKEKITIIATGPLTNIGVLLMAYPELKEKIEEIVFMGGACFGGNWTPTAEFNIFVDPEAAEIVVQSGIPIVMMGLDVTLKAQFFEKDIKKIKAINTKVSDVISGLLTFFNTRVAQPFMASPDHVEGMHLHDACAAAYVIDPSLFVTVPLYVEIDVREGITLGTTHVDYNKKLNKKENALVGFDLNLPKFTDLIVSSVKKVSER